VNIAHELDIRQFFRRYRRELVTSYVSVRGTL
jgi:hypothetical protein